MLKQKLNKVTLVTAVDNVWSLGVRAFEHCLSQFDFADALFFTSKATDYLHAIKCNPINSIADYNNFIIKELPERIETDFVLIMQWDGFIVNPESWTNEFLNYDYCGAAWSRQLNGGNGGFSLRSKYFLDTANELIPNAYTNEDILVCTTYEKQMKERGIKYAPYEVNCHFSSEQIKNPKSFGFHNLQLNPQYRDIIYGGN